MLNTDQARAFSRDGYVHGGRLLSDVQVEQLRDELDRIIQLYDRGHSEQVFIADTAAFCQSRDCFFQVTNLRELSEPFAALATSAELVGAAQQLLDTTSLRLFADTLLRKSGQNSGVNEWHQDGRAFDILREPQTVTAWVALDDVGEDDGCVCFARGSHTWTETPQEVMPRLNEMFAEASAGHDHPEVQRVLMRRGEVHFHHGLTWHCSLENRSGKTRRGYAIFYLPVTTRFNAAGSLFLKPFVESADGEPLAGRHFPLVSV